MTISDHMTNEHKHCDDFYLEAEKAASEGDWNTTRQAYQKFCQSMEQHFSMEEKVLFPDFEQAHGSEMGPTQVMRHEHEQMRSLIDSAQALDTENKDDFLGEAETLLMFMQQHNSKEEMMLYPMADQILAAQGEQVISRMQAIAEN